MELETHGMQDLFRQLGLPSSSADIERFVDVHRPLAAGVQLADVPFWSESQAQFLREAINEDADWADVVDQLNLMLRS